MKIAVTGASGFLGRHVLRALAARDGLEVVACSRSELREKLPSPAMRHVRLDHSRPSAGDYETLGRPEVLIHLAWDGLPNYKSLHHFESELPRQYAFLRSLLDAGLPRLVVTGTCYEYGKNNGQLSESFEGVPSNPYAHAKSALRQQLQFLLMSRPFELTWARLFYMYGAGQPATSLYAQLSAAAGRGYAAFSMSRGEQIRDFLPVEEVANYLVTLALRNKGAGTVNVCSGQPVSVRAFVEQLIASNAWRIALDLGKFPYPDHEPLAFWGSAEKLRFLTDSTHVGSDVRR